MSAELDQLKEREREFHERRYSDDEGKRNETRFYRALWDLETAFIEQIKQHAPGKNVLDYGCGSGERVLSVASMVSVKSLTAIDISQAAIDIVEKRAHELGLLISAQVQDCHATTFPDASFDVIYGNGILHHLEMDAAFAEIKRLLAPGGVAIFYEPMGTNPLINLYRSLTPGARSADEHPFLMADISKIKARFSKTQFVYFGFFTLAAMPFYQRPEEFAFRLTAWLDRKLLRLPIMKRLSWAVLLVTHNK